MSFAVSLEFVAYILLSLLKNDVSQRVTPCLRRVLLPSQPFALQQMSNVARTRLLTLDVLRRAGIAGTLVALSQLPLFDASPAAQAQQSDVSAASALQRWDTLHFTAIAQRGYAYEQSWAFLPGAPMIMRVLSRLVWENATSTQLTLVGSTVALLCSNVLDLYDLTIEVSGLSAVATLAGWLSLVPLSPAALIFAPYTEPFFTFLSYKGGIRVTPIDLAGLTHCLGMLFCARRRFLLAAIMFALASCFRSNGALLGGFILWPTVIEPFFSSRRLNSVRILAQHARPC